MIPQHQPLPDLPTSPPARDLPQWIDDACRRIARVTLTDLVAAGYSRDIAESDPSEAVFAVLIVADVNPDDLRVAEISDAADEAVARMAR